MGTGEVPPRPGRSREWVREGAWLAASIGAALLAIIWTLRLWDAALRIPLSPGGDTLPVIASIKSLITNGWYLTNPDLGAPFGQSLYDFAGFSGDVLQWLAIGAMGLVIGDAGLVMNLYFLLGYAFIATASFLVLRSLGASRPSSFALSVIFSMLPYHLAHGEGHLMLANYAAAPAACWLVVRIARGMPLITRSRRTGWRHFITTTNAGTAAAVIVTGGTSLYYAIFTIMLVAVATAARGIAAASWRSLVPGGLAVVGVGAVLFLSILPGLAYRWANGANTALAVRTPIESDYYSLSLGRMLLSYSGHRIQTLSDIGNAYAANSIWIGEGDAALGTALGATFVGMIIALIAFTVRGRWPASERAAIARVAIMGTLTAFLIGTLGGVGGIIANLVSPQIRAWTRITPFLAFFCAIVLALAIDWLRERPRRARWGPAFGVALPIAIALAAVLDQTSPTNIPNYRAIAAKWNSEAEFVSRIERLMPPNAMILQLPLHGFPESGPVEKMGDYDQLSGYVHSTDLRWSFGALNGRPTAWGLAVLDMPLPQLVRGAAAAGFSGAWVDRAGYKDNGVATIASIRALTGPTRSVESEGGRLVFIDLRPLQRKVQRSFTLRERQALAAQVVTPTTTTYGDGFYGEEQQDGRTWRWAQRTATLSIENRSDRTQLVRWSAGLNAAKGATVRISAGNRTLFSRRLSNGSARMVVAIPAPPGVSEVTVSSTGGRIAAGSDPRNLRLQLLDPTVTW